MIPAAVRASAGYLRRHPWQLALAMLGVAIGVAVIVAVDLANSSARKAFLLSMDAITGAATHQVIGGPRGVDERVYSDLRVEHGIRSIAPVVDDTVEVRGAPLHLLGVDLFAEREMRTFTSSAAPDSASDGSTAESLFRGFLTIPGTVAMPARTASRLDLAVGDNFEVVADGRSHRATLLAIIPGESTPDDVLVCDVATAQAWLGEPGRLTRIDVRLADGDAASLERLESALPAGNRVFSAAGRTRTTAEMSDAFMTNLTAMSLLALLVGVFLIFNSVSFSVLQRRELLATLRTLGVTRRQLFAMILAEAGIVGALAAVLGIVLGVLLGGELLALVSRSINDFYFRVQVSDVRIGALPVVKGLLAGIGTALLAAAAPAAEASAYQPRLALARSTLERRVGRFVPVVTATGTALMVAAVLLLWASGQNLVAGLVATFMLILGFSLCVPIFVRTAATLAAPVASWIGGMPARLAVAGIPASLSRTGVAVVALTVAVSATIGVSVMVTSFRSSVAEWLDGTLQADLYAGPESGSMDPGLVSEIANLPGVEAISTSRRAWLEDAHGRTRLVAIRMAPGSFAGTEILDADPADVWRAWQRDDVVLVSEPYAWRHGVGPGDVLELPTDGGPRRFRIAARYQSYDVNASAVLMSRATYDRHFDDDRVDAIGLYLAGGADAAAVIDALRTAAAGRQRIRVDSNLGIRERSLEVFDRTFVITDILYWLTLGVAVIGILSAMLALQLERARELATLRAVGMTPLQVGTMVTLQTGVIGLLSGLASIPLGAAMAWVLIKIINRRAFGWQIDMTLAPEVLLASVSLAVLAAIVAGIYPALRAARLRPAAAMREE